MTKCTECRYFIRYNENATCLMKNDFQVVGDCTIYPKNCKDFYNGGDVE